MVYITSSYRTLDNPGSRYGGVAMVNLGQRYYDKVTGSSGVATARVEYVTGVPRVQLETLEHDGKKIVSAWFDEDRLLGVNTQEAEPETPQEGVEHGANEAREGAVSEPKDPHDAAARGILGELSGIDRILDDHPRSKTTITIAAVRAEVVQVRALLLVAGLLRDTLQR